jgi:AcrR family transcriptional regulator
MARPTVIRDESILEAARAVFLERGALATSAQVAQRAGVSEGSLFKRFKTKADLFKAAMGLDETEEPRAMRHLAERVGLGTVDGNLTVAGLGMIEYLERIMPIMMMSWSNPKLNDCLPSSLDVPDPPPLRAQRLLGAYLEAEMMLGRVRPLETPIISRAFLGALNTYVYFEMLARKRGGQIDRDHYVREYVKTLWEGMRPRPAKERV